MQKYAGLLLLVASGCETLRWATTDQNGVPAVKAITEGADSALSAWAEGGAAAGALALIFTTAKTLLRLWGRRKLKV